MLVVLALGLLGACGTGSGSVEWRDVTVEVPDGWAVAERDEQKLSIANVDFGPGQGDELEAAVFLTREPDTSIDDWRSLVAERDGEVETDDAITVGGMPANRLVFRHDANGTPLREMVVVVPSRDVVMLFQPVVLRGSPDGPDVFERYRDTFDEVLTTVRFAPSGGGTPPPELSIGSHG
ncbi:MAG: hypothetical protein KY437_09150 [Actinobacteria bacterium]|nr:hypothetical protein [Actinomycetota bacterium]